MMTTEAAMTAWEIWDQESDKLWTRLCDAEGNVNEVDSIVRDSDETIHELELALKKEKSRRARMAGLLAGRQVAFETAKKKYDAHQLLEPEQD